MNGRGVVAVEVTDRPAWNAAVAALPGHDPRQGWEWGEIQRQAGWTPHRYAVGDAGASLGAVSILARRLPGTPWSILYAPRGPVLDWKDETAWAGIAGAVRAVATRTRAIFLRVSPGAPDEEPAPRERLRSHGFIRLPDDYTTWNVPRLVMTTRLDGSWDDVRSRVRKRFREYVASAPRRGLTVRPAAPAEVPAFHAALAAMGREKGYPVRDLGFFARLAAEYAASGNGVLLVVEHAGQLAGGLAGVRLGRRACMLYASVHTGAEASRLHQGPPLYWGFVQWAKEAGCDEIDWGGSGTHLPPRPDDPGHGVYQFKLGFGAVLERVTGYYDLVFRPPLYRAFRLAEARVLPLAWSVRARIGTWGRP